MIASRNLHTIHLRSLHRNLWQYLVVTRDLPWSEKVLLYIVHHSLVPLRLLFSRPAERINQFKTRHLVKKMHARLVAIEIKMMFSAAVTTEKSRKLPSLSSERNGSKPLEQVPRTRLALLFPDCSSLVEIIAAAEAAEELYAAEKAQAKKNRYHSTLS